MTGMAPSRSPNRLQKTRRLVLQCIMVVPFFCIASPQTSIKIDSASQARIDSLPADSSKFFTEVPEWKPFMDSAFSAFFKDRGKSFQWKNFRYPFKLSRSFFDSKLKKNRVASANKGPRLSRQVEGEAFAISEDRTLVVELFKGENAILVCNTIMYDVSIGRMVWSGHVKGSKGSTASIYFDKNAIFIRIRMLEQAPFTIYSPFNSNLYMLEQLGPSLYPVDIQSVPLDHSGG
ncbi:MAG: hypothetical protein ABI036_01430 [Fibrobacteria bacterium]